MNVSPVKSNDYVNVEFISNPTVAVNLVGFLEGYARRHHVNLADVIIEASGKEMFVHTGWNKNPARD